MTEKQARQRLLDYTQAFDTNREAAEDLEVSVATLSGALSGDRAISGALARKLGLRMTIKKTRVYELEAK